MAAYAFVLKVKPGYEAEYENRHKKIWPEMSDFLTEVGFKNYHIYRYGLTLFAHFECDNLEKLIQKAGNSEVNQRWFNYMQPIMEIDIDPQTNFPFLLPKMFIHL